MADKPTNPIDQALEHLVVKVPPPAPTPPRVVPGPLPPTSPEPVMQIDWPPKGGSKRSHSQEESSRNTTVIDLCTPATW